MQDKSTARVTVTVQVLTYAQAIANNRGVASANKIARGAQPRGRGEREQGK